MNKLIQILIAALTSRTSTDLIVSSMVKTVQKLEAHSNKSSDAAAAHIDTILTASNEHANIMDALQAAHDEAMKNLFGKHSEAMEEAAKAARLAAKIGGLLA